MDPDSGNNLSNISGGALTAAIGVSSADSLSRPTHKARRVIRKLLTDLAASQPAAWNGSLYRRKVLGMSFRETMDRVNVLGDGQDGHTGCVNALSWSLGGEVLLSGGDDTTVQIWRMDSSSTSESTPYPFKCDSVIHTGHTGNIFNAHLLPGSSRIATVAGDKQVRVFDAERALTTSSSGRSADFYAPETCIRVLKCHTGRTKRIVAEESSDLFLTVAEDGTVRQHDLRVSHACSREREECPPPLVQLPHELSTLTMSPLLPYQFVVAGESPYAYLFDRRQTGRVLKEEWGVPCDTEELVTCVRRFGRTRRGEGERPGKEHVTGARLSQTNGHELLLSYSADTVYLYSIRDEPHTSEEGQLSPVLPTNKKHDRPPYSSNITQTTDPPAPESDAVEMDTSGSSDGSNPREGQDEASHDDDDEEEERSDEDSSVGGDLTQQLEMTFRRPVVLPRARYDGACNIETVKDVNFVGPDEEYVASGSDDGNFFLWEKDTRKLHGIYEGDGSVVNVIEGHPILPLLAVSGIDTTVKLFAPVRAHSEFSRMDRAESIMSNNSRTIRMQNRLQNQRGFGLASLLLQYRQYQLAMRLANGGASEDDEETTCTHQ